MIRLFDYIFYRWYQFYRSNTRFPEVHATGMVIGYQLFTIINLVSIFCIVSEINRPDKKFILPLALILIAINYFKYEKNADISKYDSLWKEEPAIKKRQKMVFMVSYLVINFLLPLTYGIAKYS